MYLARILTTPERIKLFKEINRVHREVYGSKILYRCAWGGDYIDIENNDRFDHHNEWVPIGKSDIGKYYFQDYKGKEITLLRGVFEWEAYYFHHLNPYKPYKYSKLTEGDFITDNLGRRIRPDINHPVDCLETTFEVLQRKDDGRIWISSSWLYHPDCYGSGEGFGDEIYDALTEAAGGDEKVAKDLQVKYEAIKDSNRREFEKALERYFKGGKLQSKYWNWGYLLAASRERRIKTPEQLNEAMVEEGEHFRGSLEGFIGWLRCNGLNLGRRLKKA